MEKHFLKKDRDKNQLLLDSAVMGSRLTGLDPSHPRTA